MEIEEIVKQLKDITPKKFKNSIHRNLQFQRQSESLTFAIEILQRINMDRIKNIIEKARWECNVEIISGMATNKATENYARAVIKYLKGEKYE